MVLKYKLVEFGKTDKHELYSLMKGIHCCGYPLDSRKKNL